MIFLLYCANIVLPTARESLRLTINYETTEHIEFLNLHSQRTMQVGAFSVREAACPRVAQITTLITVLDKHGAEFYMLLKVSWLSGNMPII